MVILRVMAFWFNADSKMIDNYLWLSQRADGIASGFAGS